MALLKLYFSMLSNAICFSFHGWKIMALLKLSIPPSGLFHFSKFPWLKNHGPIEAHTTWIITHTHHPRFHGWKIMALLKLCSVSLIICSVSHVSMVEKSWPYWSVVFVLFRTMTPSSFHGWKIMALLKLFIRFFIIHSCVWFPWLKNHGPIEAWNRSDMELTNTFEVSTDEKSCPAQIF